MKSPVEAFRDATDEEVKELRQVALTEHLQLGIEQPSEVTIQVRVRSLAQQRHLRLPGGPQSQKANKHPSKVSPNYLQAGLEQEAQKCAKNRRAARRKKHIRIVRENTDRFYLFCFLKGGFGRELRTCRALEVLAALVEQLCGDIETWVSIQTLAKRLGRTPKTVAKALREMEKKRIVTVTNAADRDYSLNGKEIGKNQGYVIQLHPPMFWDWKSIGGVPEWMRRYLADYGEEDTET